MSVDDRHDDDPALDRLLAQAKWEEPTAADEYRLREDWMHLRRRRRIGSMVSLAMAAVVVLGMGTIALIQTRPHPEREYAASQPSPPKMLLIEPARVESRPANAMEVLVAMHDRRPVAPPGLAKARTELDPAVQVLVRQLGDPLVSRRFEAAHTLAGIEEPELVPILAEMVDRGASRREALAALMWSKDPAAGRALVAMRQSSMIDAQVRALEQEFQ